MSSEDNNQAQQDPATDTDVYSAAWVAAWYETPVHVSSSDLNHETDIRTAPNNPEGKDSTHIQKEAKPKDPESPKNTGSVPRRRNLLRPGIGALLFVAWGLLTILWVASTIHSVAAGDIISLVTAAAALALLILLGVMEGLEVSVIDRWQTLWPGQSMNYLARWLAARQLFVALIVTGATLLANRSVIVIPGTSTRITDAFTLGVFDLTWTTLTVLWFAQIFPKHLGATNPDRYLERLRQAMFPVVEVVRLIGVSQPGEWTADVIEAMLDWPLSHDELVQHRANKHSLGEIWCELRRGRTYAVDQSQPEKE